MAPIDAILVATPSTDDKKISVYQFPDERLKYVVPKISTTDSGKQSCLAYHASARTSTSFRDSVFPNTLLLRPEKLWTAG